MTSAVEVEKFLAAGRQKVRKIMKNKEVKITTIIGKDAECNGDFHSEGCVRVDGTINGDVTVSGTLIVGTTGVINGDVNARAAVVGGEIVGNITITEKTELTCTARVLGNITTLLIVIDENAIFQGSCNMNQDMTGKRPRPNPKAVRAGRKSGKEALEEALKDAEEADREGRTTQSDSSSDTENL